MHRIAPVVLAGLNLYGCAAMQTNGVPAQVSIPYPKKALVVETPVVMDEPVFDKLFAPDSPTGSPETRQAVKRGVNNAEAQVLTEMRSVLQTHTEIAIEDNQDSSRAVSELRINNAATTITKELADKLRAVSGADVLLRFRITDYGVTPKSWRNAVITFEVTSTLGIAAVAYSYPATRALAGIYLVQEGVEETAEAYAGFWALDKVCRPVRIEAQLFNLTTGAQVWTGTATGLSDIHLARIFKKVGAAERGAQLDSAVHEAVTNIVGNLQAALSK